MVLLKQFSFDIDQGIQNIFLHICLHVLGFDLELVKEFVFQDIMIGIMCFLNRFSLVLPNYLLSVLIRNLQIEQLFPQLKIILEVRARVFFGKENLVLLLFDVAIHLSQQFLTFLFELKLVL